MGQKYQLGGTLNQPPAVVVPRSTFKINRKKRAVIDDFAFQVSPSNHYGVRSTFTDNPYWSGWLSGMYGDYTPDGVDNPTWNPLAGEGEVARVSANWPSGWINGFPEAQTQRRYVYDVDVQLEVCKKLANGTDPHTTGIDPNEECWYLPNLEANNAEWKAKYTSMTPPPDEDQDIESMIRMYRYAAYNWRIAKPNGLFTYYYENAALAGAWTPSYGFVDWTSPTYRSHPSFPVWQKTNDRLAVSTAGRTYGLLDACDGITTAHYFNPTQTKNQYERMVAANAEEILRLKRSDQLMMAYVWPATLSDLTDLNECMTWVGAIHRRLGFDRLINFGYNSADSSPQSFYAYWRSCIACLSEGFV
jgi:hypothetical protein